MEASFQGNKSLLIANCLSKSNQALGNAQYNLKDDRYAAALNCIYYSIFYSTLALGYQFDFITSKHQRLLGWFNKKFIYEDKLFDKKMMEIYPNAFLNRQEADYDISNIDALDKQTVEESLKEAIYFCKEIKKYFDNLKSSD